MCDNTMTVVWSVPFLVVTMLTGSITSAPGKQLSKVISPEEEARMNELSKQIRFLLWDRRKSDWFPILHNDSIPVDVWVPDGSVKLIIHGYTFKEYQTTHEKLDEQNIWRLGKAYGNHNNSLNVFVLDWTVLSTEPLPRYIQAAQSTRFVGKAVAEFLVRLKREEFIKSWDNVHIMGFSLGGHTVGVVGSAVQDLTGEKIGRITGLDPAGPFFDVKGKMPEDVSGFLEKSDGKFVDIIHCNMKLPGMTIIGHLGSCVEAGHADFYPDSGTNQLFCSEASDKSDTPCSHMSCPMYMALSLTHELIACPCESWKEYEDGKCDCTLETGGMLMGDPCSPRASGRYYLKMNKFINS